MGAVEDNGRLNRRIEDNLNTSTDIKYEMVEYEILWINSYGFNYQLKQSDEKKLFNTLNRIQKFSEC